MVELMLRGLREESLDRINRINRIEDNGGRGEGGKAEHVPAGAGRVACRRQPEGRDNRPKGTGAQAEIRTEGESNRLPQAA